MKEKLKRNFILYLLLIIGFGLFIYSSYNMYKWYIDSTNTNNIIETVSTFSPPQKEVNDELNEEIIDGIDLTELKKINPDAIGWIKVNGTNIDLPFTQTNNNEFYLNHSFDKSINSAGWVFLDYRNNINDLDKNTILYAHGRLDKTMFGSLKDVLEPSWYENSNNHIIEFSTEKQRSTWQVFSTYHIPVTSDYIKTDFLSDEDYEEFINMIKKRSSHNFEVNVNASDKVLTLSTCYNNNSKERLVIHAKLNV